MPLSACTIDPRRAYKNNVGVMIVGVGRSAFHLIKVGPVRLHMSHLMLPCTVLCKELFACHGRHDYGTHLCVQAAS